MCTGKFDSFLFLSPVAVKMKVIYDSWFINRKTHFLSWAYRNCISFFVPSWIYLQKTWISSHFQEASLFFDPNKDQCFFVWLGIFVQDHKKLKSFDDRWTAAVPSNLTFFFFFHPSGLHFHYRGFLAKFMRSGGAAEVSLSFSHFLFALKVWSCSIQQPAGK